ncbi:hypothetical protein PITCH_A530001 [uncultured Desulfobacterium sp.]|uniref:Uncharacterized protein n=1 Tax=uncultured Desulfobacterium sp. TaxID=201089 RepID=A0A445N0X4_9BACT|nr:hypothetical protein PITCH_A530001 [uncultured Desulfobacterium sp.]
MTKYKVLIILRDENYFMTLDKINDFLFHEFISSIRSPSMNSSFGFA